MLLRKNYFYDNITTTQHRDFFPQIDKWAYKNNLVQDGNLIFPVGTKFVKTNEDMYYCFFTVILPNKKCFKHVPVSWELYEELEECI